MRMANGVKLKDRIDMHCHYMPPAYTDMLDKRGIRFVDGGMPVPAWSVQRQLESMELVDPNDPRLKGKHGMRIIH